MMQFYQTLPFILLIKLLVVVKCLIYSSDLCSQTAAGLGNYVEILVRKPETEFNVSCHPFPTISNVKKNWCNSCNNNRTTMDLFLMFTIAY